MAGHSRYGAQSIRGIAAAAILLSFHGTVFAQPASAENDDEWLEEVVVTGSRIVRRDFASPSPITTIDRDAIESSAHATLEETLNRMPQILPDFGRTSNNPGDGTARINLRGLGPGRSLVMLNSRRLAPSGMGSARRTSSPRYSSATVSSVHPAAMTTVPRRRTVSIRH